MAYKRKSNNALFLFYGVVLVYVLISLLGGKQSVTGLAPSRLSTLHDINNSITSLLREQENNFSASRERDIGKKMIEYQIAKAKLQGLREGNEPFFLEGRKDRGVILIHGFSASPNEVKELAEYLHKKDNLTVYAPLLAGHGTDPVLFGNYHWNDWLGSVQDAYDAMTRMTDHTYLGGISLGGNLALELGKTEDTAGIFTIGAPVFFRNKLIKTSPVLQLVIGDLPNKKLDDEEKKYYYYNRSVAAIAQLSMFITVFRQNLDKIQEPVFILQSDSDQTIQPSSAYYIYERVGSKEKTLQHYPGDSHIIIDQEAKKRAFQDILNFILEPGSYENISQS